MEKVSFEDYCRIKAFELAYALCRVVPSGRASHFAAYLEKYACELIDAAHVNNYGRIAQVISIIEHFLNLGVSAELVPHSHTQVIIREAEELKAAIAEFGDQRAAPGFDMESAFSKIGIQRKKEPGKKERINPAIAPSSTEEPGNKNGGNAVHAALYDNPAIAALEEIRQLQDGEPGNEISYSKNDGQDIAMRQLGIVAKIKLQGQSRFKDLQEAFPAISERTLRYDLQRLIEAGQVIRVGQGGPTSYYEASHAAF